ncbi:MAG: hypothetical protein Q8K57_13310 [Thiobacillus sp.]|nr:hypothetical protein [Thiobacillus sp.]
MGTIGILLLIGVVLWYLIHVFKSGDAAPSVTNHSINKMDDDPLKKASRTLEAAMHKCSEDHDFALQSLLWLAGTDGTISKQEARNVFRFCERQGTVLPAGTYEALEYLNNGMHISTEYSPSEALSALASMVEKPIQYRAAFIGAAHAICGGNKRISKVKQDFLDRTNVLVEAST